MTKGMIQMWAVFSEMEKDMIKQRVKSGMENAKAKGKRLGRPELSKEQIPDAFYKYYSMHKNGILSISEMARVLECSRAKIYRYINCIEDEA